MHLIECITPDHNTYNKYPYCPRCQDYGRELVSLDYCGGNFWHCSQCYIWYIEVKHEQSK